MEKAKENVDKFIEHGTEYELGELTYVHVPLWFIKYEYRKNTYDMIVDGHAGRILLGDLPPADVGMF